MRVRRSDGSRPLDTRRHLPLGIERDETYTDQTVRLTPGDVLVLYTDGITEAKNENHDLFGMERLDAALRASDGSAAGAVADVLRAVDEFTGHRAPDDDRTLLAARVL